MLTAFLVTIVLLIMGCCIAYFGDTWGYKLGKKRLTLFGLRPRVTANLLTVIAGGVIALVTFGVLLAVNANFRTAITQGVQLEQKNLQLKGEIQLKTSQIRDQSAKIQALQQEADQYHTQAAQEVTKEHIIGAKLADTSTKLAARQTQLQTVDSRLQVEHAQLANAHTEVAALQAQQQRLMRLKDTLDASIKVRLKNPLIYTNGAEVGRTVVSASQSQTAIRRDIMDFLGRLSDQAKLQGASKDRDGSYAPVATVRIGNTTTLVNESDSISALASQIQSQGKGSVVVIAYAVGNSFANKPVFVRLKPYSNRLVIPAGAILGETVIPSQQKGVAEILADMQTFLKGPVHEAALRRGLIPVLPQDSIGGAYGHEIDPAVQQIQQIKGDAVLVAVSRQDTYAGDQLSLDFAVHAASAQPVAAQGVRP